jgi:putative ABC transport system permease protein
MNPSLELGPILRSMRHHKGSFSLLVLEVALGFVMLTHTLIAMRYYYRVHVRPTGMPEDELIVARRRFLHPRDVAAARSAERADLAALGKVGVPVAAIDAPPLPDAAAYPGVLRRPGETREHLAWPVRATPDVAAALGLQVIAGAGLGAPGATAPPDGATPVLLTSTAAEQIFGTYDRAVGQAILGSSFGPGRVAGVVRDIAFRGTWLPAEKTIVIIAAEPVSEHELIYVMHAPDGRRAPVIEAAAGALAGAADADSTVVVRGLERSTTRFAKISGGAVIVLIWTGFLVVAVALAGSLAMASFSVAERTRQIGVRRALGASRGEIVAYFLLENLILTAFGLALGLCLAIGLNQVLRRIMIELKLTVDEVLISMLVFHVTGLLSALVPARRAALIPPWAATRTL